MTVTKMIGLIPFTRRHWNPSNPGTKVLGMTPEEFVEMCNKALAEGAELRPGNDASNRHLFLKNETETLCGYMPITPENEKYIVRGEEARRPGEKPVPFKRFEGISGIKAVYFDVVLYSREQLMKEAKAGWEDAIPEEECEWGIVSINTELTETSSPQSPETIKRNAKGVAEGGSGVVLDEEALRMSEEFWARHAKIV